MKTKNILLTMLFILLASGAYLGLVSEKIDPIAQAKWLTEHNLMLENNRLNSLKILNPTFKFKSLEIIHVGPGKQYFSLFGHVLVRFVGSADKPVDDLTLSFLADFNEFKVDNIKGWFGGDNGYVVLPKISPFREYIKEYAVGENRYLIRHALNTTNEQNKNVLAVLKAWIRNPYLPGPYAFRENHCVGVINKMFKTADFPLNGPAAFFPWEIAGYFKDNGLITLPKIIIKGANQYPNKNDVYNIKNIPELSIR